LAEGLCKFYANARGKQPIQRQPLLVQYKQEANPLLLTHNYTPLAISRNDKNKQLTIINPILHTAWLDNHALTLKISSAKYYFYEKYRFLHTFLKFCCESRKI
jgi:hypothetical protein